MRTRKSERFFCADNSTHRIALTVLSQNGAVLPIPPTKVLTYFRWRLCSPAPRPLSRPVAKAGALSAECFPTLATLGPSDGVVSDPEINIYYYICFFLRPTPPKLRRGHAGGMC